MKPTWTYTVGQKLWMQGNERYVFSCEVTVTKIGRKWVELNDGDWRVERDSRFIDGGDYSSPGTLYESKAAYEDLLARSRAWHALQGDMHYARLPEGVTVAAIAQARALLKL